MFTGSILDLDPDTEYECRFRMSDPDGVDGKKNGLSEKIVAVRTRAEPKPYRGGRVYHVYPRDFEGPKEEPAFANLMAAYYTGWCEADWWNVAPPRVQPGDTILVHAGLYVDDPTFYGADGWDQGTGTPIGGTYYLTAKGTPEKPIAIKAAGIQAVIAKSFARIFYRNAFNIGLPIFESADASERIQQNDEVEIDADKGVIRNMTTKEVYSSNPIPPFMQELIDAGGLIAWTKRKLKNTSGT